MNILFYTDYKVAEHKGGTERTTLLLSDALHDQYGHICYSLYAFADDSYVSAPFSGGVCQLPLHGRLSFLKDFLEKNSIDIIIVQGNFLMATVLSKVLLAGSACRIIMAHHYAPAWEVHNCTLGNYLNVLRHSKGFAMRTWYALKCLAFPLFRYRDIHNLHTLYRRAYDNADRVVLLSEKYKEGFMRFADISEDSKFSFIPNMLSFHDSLSEDDMQGKKKEVLIVGRLEEESKRISVALELWREIKTHPESDGWILNIVGSGPDEDSYRQQVEKDHIKDVVFHGRQDPQPFYQRASLFMMTSRSEAWPMTIAESLQMGCVPVVFNSFAAIHDIICDSVDGIIVEEGDNNSYVAAMLNLMNNKSLRQSIAEAGKNNCRRFSCANIAMQWEMLFRSL